MLRSEGDKARPNGEVVLTACPRVSPEIDLGTFESSGPDTCNADIGASYEIQSCDDLVFGQWTLEQTMVASSITISLFGSGKPLASAPVLPRSPSSLTDEAGARSRTEAFTKLNMLRSKLKPNGGSISLFVHLGWPMIQP